MQGDREGSGSQEAGTEIGPPPPAGATWGVIGTGAIAEALLRGLAGAEALPPEVLVTSRSRERSEHLASEHSAIQVVDDVPEIVERSQWLLLSVRPEQLEPLVPSLRLRPDHGVLSLVAGTSLQSLGKMLAPATRIHRAIPLPPVERRVGPLPLVRPDPGLEAFLSPLGTVLPVEDEGLFQALAAASALMASHFELVARTARWLRLQGADAGTATDYATSLFVALSGEYEGASPQHLSELSQECLTKGGLNEQVLRELDEKGWFEAVDGRLDRILERLVGGSARPG